MTRLGWGILGLILVTLVGFLSLTSFGVTEGSRIRAALTRAPAPVLASVAAAPVPGGPGLIVPVSGVARTALYDSWGDARDGGTRQHHGTDIPAPAGTPVIAAAPGRVEKLFQSAAGGTTLYVRSPDGRWTYYYAHLAGYAPGVHEGMAVRTGDSLGFVGDTGDAGAGNFHLHFGMARMQPGEHWWQGTDVDPFPLLAAGRLPG